MVTGNAFGKATGVGNNQRAAQRRGVGIPLVSQAVLPPGKPLVGRENDHRVFKLTAVAERLRQAANALVDRQHRLVVLLHPRIKASVVVNRHTVFVAPLAPHVHVLRLAWPGAEDICGNKRFRAVRQRALMAGGWRVGAMDRGVAEPKNPGLFPVLLAMNEIDGEVGVAVGAIPVEALCRSAVDVDRLASVVGGVFVRLAVVPDHRPVPSGAVLVHADAFAPVPLADHSGGVALVPEVLGPVAVASVAHVELQTPSQHHCPRWNTLRTDKRLRKANAGVGQLIDVGCCRERIGVG